MESALTKADLKESWNNSPLIIKIRRYHIKGRLMFRDHSLLFLLLFTTVIKVAAGNVPQLPMDLLYNDKPIDSLCFQNPEKNTLDLAHCGAKQQKLLPQMSNEQLLKKGYIGYDWKDPTLPSHAPRGYSYYRFFQAGKHQYWIYSVNNGGGTGVFTAIYLVQRNALNTLKIDYITGGDRCNGGIQDNVFVQKNKLNFKMNLTSYDLIALAKPSLRDLKAYDDLAACAVCCVATGTYTANLDKLNFAYVKLNNIEEDLPGQGKYQTCFNQLYVEYINRKGLKMTQNELKEFANAFNQSCVRMPSKRVAI